MIHLFIPNIDVLLYIDKVLIKNNVELLTFNQIFNILQINSIKIRKDIVFCFSVL